MSISLLFLVNLMVDVIELNGEHGGSPYLPAIAAPLGRFRYGTPTARSSKPSWSKSPQAKDEPKANFAG